jgi:solute carrier family 50 protein (sugar transporter)
MELKEIVLEHIFPIGGIITSIFIFYSPFASIKEVSRTGNIGSVNTFVFVMMITNSLAWMLYGMQERNMYILGPNLFGFLFGIYYCLSALPYQESKARSQTVFMLLFGFFICFLCGGISFIYFDQSTVGEFILGIQANLILTIFYSSPLSVIAKVMLFDIGYFSKELRFIEPISCHGKFN